MNHRISQPRPITVFGAANMDHIGATSGPPIAGASNPGIARANPGGVGFNIAVILAQLGHTVRLVARVGDDAAGAAIRAAVLTAGVDTTHLGVSETEATATYLAALDNHGNLVIGIAGMAIHDDMTPSIVAPAIDDTPEGDLWIVDANLPAETLGFLCGRAKDRGHPVVALAVSPVKSVKLAPLLGEIDLLLVNRKEAAAILQRPATAETASAAQLAGALAGRPRPDVIVTDAAAPLAAISAGVVRSFQPLPVSAGSVNGAGDALAAGVIHGLAHGRPLFEAVQPGLAAAAITVEHEGTVPAALSAAALIARMNAGRDEEPE